MRKKALLIAAISWTAVVLGDDTKENGSENLAQIEGSKAWPMHRGGPSLMGQALGEILDSVELVWTFDTGAPVVSSAAIANGRVFIGSNSGRIHALELRSGKELWSFETGGAVEASPCLVGDLLYIGSSDSLFYALESVSGSLRWKFQSGDRILGGANAARMRDHAETLILFGSYDGSLYCLDAKTGALRWEFATDSYLNGTAAVLPGGRAVVGGCDSSIYTIRLSDGVEVGRIDTQAYIAGSIAVSEGVGFLGHYNNEVIAFDVDTSEILWTYKARSFPYFSSPAVTMDSVLIGGRDRQLHCIDRSDGTSRWTFQTKGPIDSSPVVIGKQVIFGSGDGRLYAVSLADGAKDWSYAIGTPIIASPAIADGMLVIGAEDGRVYGFEAR